MKLFSFSAWQLLNQSRFLSNSLLLITTMLIQSRQAINLSVFLFQITLQPTRFRENQTQQKFSLAKAIFRKSSWKERISAKKLG